MTFWCGYGCRIRGSMPLTNGSGCGSGSSYFSVIDIQDANKKVFFFKSSAFTSFLKKSKRSHKAVGTQDFSDYFCLVIEGSGSQAGSKTLTNEFGSGSRRPKNIRIQRIRIRNTCFLSNILGRTHLANILDGGLHSNPRRRIRRKGAGGGGHRRRRQGGGHSGGRHHSTSTWKYSCFYGICSFGKGHGLILIRRRSQHGPNNYTDTKPKNFVFTGV